MSVHDWEDSSSPSSFKCEKNRLRDLLKETKGPNDHNVGNRVVNRWKYQNKGANAM